MGCTTKLPMYSYTTSCAQIHSKPFIGQTTRDQSPCVCMYVCNSYRCMCDCVYEGELCKPKLYVKCVFIYMCICICTYSM